MKIIKNRLTHYLEWRCNYEIF